MPVLFPDQDGVVAVPSVKVRLLHLFRHCEGLAKWWDGMVRLSDAAFIEGRHAYGPSGIAVVLGGYYHSVTPGDRIVSRNWFEDA